MLVFTDGPLEYFLNFGYGSLRQLEGERIYHKTVVGVSLVACAHLCLAENTFRCTSFDYEYNDKSCHMSMYIAANVYGLVTSQADDKSVVHYEFIGNFFWDQFRKYLLVIHTTTSNTGLQTSRKCQSWPTCAKLRKASTLIWQLNVNNWPFTSNVLWKYECLLWVPVLNWNNLVRHFFLFVKRKGQTYPQKLYRQ